MKAPFQGILALCGIWILIAPANPARGADGSPPAAPRRGGTLRLATEDDPFSLDPFRLFSNHAAALSFLIFDSLVEHGLNGTLVPALAEELPSVTEDGLTYTFRLRSGVRFSNGRAMTAQDVVYSFERGCDPTVAANADAFFRNIRGSVAFGAARSREAGEGIVTRGDPMLRRRTPTSVDGLRALDARTFELRLESPDLTAPGRVAAIGIVPMEEVSRPDRDFGTRPVGTGAFLLKEWRRGARIRLERNPGGFRSHRVHLDAVEVLMNMDLPTQAMMFDRGEIDLMFFLAEPDVHRWRKDPRMRDRFVTFKGSCPYYVALNCELPPFTNRLVRQALNHAVNRDAIVRRLLNRAVAAQGPLPASMRGYDPGLKGYAYDPARARLLLAEAGFPDGFETKLWCMPGSGSGFTSRWSGSSCRMLPGSSSAMGILKWSANRGSRGRVLLPSGRPFVWRTAGCCDEWRRGQGSASGVALVHAVGP